jgi:hypothetical protein
MFQQDDVGQGLDHDKDHSKKRALLLQGHTNGGSRTLDMDWKWLLLTTLWREIGGAYKCHSTREMKPGRTLWD